MHEQDGVGRSLRGHAEEHEKQQTPDDTALLGDQADRRRYIARRRVLKSSVTRMTASLGPLNFA